jgi:hypothetical protein
MHVVPGGPEQMVVPLAVNNIPADAANGQSRGAADRATAVKSFFVISHLPAKASIIDNCVANPMPLSATPYKSIS